MSSQTHNSGSGLGRSSVGTASGAMASSMNAGYAGLGILLGPVGRPGFPFKCWGNNKHTINETKHVPNLQIHIAFHLLGYNVPTLHFKLET